MCSGWEKCTARIAANGKAICWRFATPVTDSRNWVAQRPTTVTRLPPPDLSQSAAAALFDRVIAGTADAAEQELFRAQMLTEMARMSLEDGFVIAAPSRQPPQSQSRKYLKSSAATSEPIFPRRPITFTPFAAAAGPLSETTPRHSYPVTLDESAYGRELARCRVLPLSPLGPPWWFFDSPEGMMRFRELTTETAGFYNTVGFTTTPAPSSPYPRATDVARRVDCAFLARAGRSRTSTRRRGSHRGSHALAYDLARKAYVYEHVFPAGR